MSSTSSSPLKTIATKADELLKYEFTVAAYRAGLSEIWRLASEDTAFDALLAVAKAAGATAEHPSGRTYVSLEDAVKALDAAHPGWREWGS